MYDLFFYLIASAVGWAQAVSFFKQKSMRHPLFITIFATTRVVLSAFFLYLLLNSSFSRSIIMVIFFGATFSFAMLRNK